MFELSVATKPSRDAREWRCANCGEVLDYVEDGTWTEEDAIAEKEASFPDVPIEACAQVCDDCYRRICINLN